MKQVIGYNFAPRGNSETDTGRDESSGVGWVAG
jgi:hypothetical protein